MATAPLRKRVTFYAWEDVVDRPQFDRRAVVRALSELNEEAWILDEGDMTTAAIVDRPGRGDAPTCLRLFRLRAGDDVPHKIDRRRNTAPIEILEDEAVTDWTHVVIWADNYAAHDPHRDAPRLGRLAAYLRARADQRVRFLPLYDATLVERLRRLQAIRAVELKIETSPDAQLAADRERGLFGGLLAMGREAEAATISAKISVGRSRTQHLGGNVQRELLDLADRAEDVLDTFVVTGIEDGRTVTIDLLKQRVEEVRQVRRSADGLRAPDTGAMYDAIIAARADLDERGTLRAATRARV